ncbi:DUF1441 family protein [Marinobacterium litorale]|uniref:DUF1441 family protein n=1 Tax=Marinobacterium litorale TaxID=404770 RepID=UPI000416648D|nr:DUF1441 family protein [Marinobacterium litorale]
MAEINRIEDAYSWNITRLAEAFGFHRGTIRQRLNAAGVIPSGVRNGANVYALKDAGPAIFADVVVAGGVNPDELPPTEMRAWYQAQNERVKLEQTLRGLVVAEEVHREMGSLAKAVATTLDSLPDILERDCGLPGEAVDRVQSVIDSLRDQMYQRIIEDDELDGECAADQA